MSTLQIADQRPALTQAFHLARERNETAALAVWEADLARMVAEVTAKFHRSLTMEDVRTGLTTTIGILDLGLLHATRGAIDAEAFLAHLHKAGIKAISREAISLVKTCAALPESDFMAVRGETPPSGGDTARDLLKSCAEKGYAHLMEKLSGRQAIAREIDLARWMLLNSAVGRLVRNDPDGTVGEMPTAEDIHFYVLVREVGVPKGELHENYVRMIELPPKLHKEARKRYDAFVAKIPAPLKPALFYQGESWFERMMSLDA